MGICTILVLLYFIKRYVALYPVPCNIFFDARETPDHVTEPPEIAKLIGRVRVKLADLRGLLSRAEAAYGDLGLLVRMNPRSILWAAGAVVCLPLACAWLRWRISCIERDLARITRLIVAAYYE